MSKEDAFEWYKWANAVRARTDVRPSTKLVAYALAQRAANATGECDPSERRLALDCGLKLTTKKKDDKPDGPTADRSSAVGFAVKQLVTLGALVVVESGTGRKRSLYRLVSVAEWVGTASAVPTEGVATAHEVPTGPQAWSSEDHIDGPQGTASAVPELLLVLLMNLLLLLQQHHP